MPKAKAATQPARPLSATLKVTKPKSASIIPRLQDVGTIDALPPPGVRQDIVSLIQYVKTYAFDTLPEQAGMNSTQISATLRFRDGLPPIVSLAHLYALSTSPTNTERELARLIAQGKLRKVSILGRGKGGTAIGDGIVLVEDWEAIVNKADVPETVKSKYITLLRSQPNSLSTSTITLDVDSLRSLVAAGLLTTPTALAAGASDPFTPLLTDSSLLTMARPAPTGSLAAVGGINALHDHGGSGNALATSRELANRKPLFQAKEMIFSLPATGPYLKLQASARAHLLALLRQISPKWKESTIDLLREKWNGGLGSFDIREMKKARKEGNGLLPGKTRKWREFMGLRFEYVLAEALGCGALEMFDTGSVGQAVRMR